MTRILRVFPRRTTHTPTDPMAFVGDPPLWQPAADEVHVSCTFSWDVPEAHRLAHAWGHYYPIVQIGGPAFDSPAGPFTPGLYVRHGITYTSRGCNNKCPWCLVPAREGPILELPISPGHIVQDNNLLQTSSAHQEQVFHMLADQPRAAIFAGGLQASLVDEWHARLLRAIRVNEVWLACDTPAALPALQRAGALLAFLGRQKLRAYVLVGHQDETPDAAAARLEAVWAAGFLPFVQLYHGPYAFTPRHHDWRPLVHKWSRPAATIAAHKEERRP